jgi:hypothetical protein
MHLYPPQRSDEPRSHFVQFSRMFTRQLLQNLSPFAREAQNGSAFVFLIRSSLDQIFPLRPVDQFDGAVVLEAEPAGGIGDCHRRSLGSSSNLQQQLMLLRLQTCFLCSTFAELQKAPQLVPKISQGVQQTIGVFRLNSHKYIVTRYTC